MNNPNEPAMPCWELNGQGVQEMTATGLTKREEIASRLLAALFANPSVVVELRDVDLDENALFLIDAADDAALQLLHAIEKCSAEEDDE